MTARPWAPRARFAIALLLTAWFVLALPYRTGAAEPSYAGVFVIGRFMDSFVSASKRMLEIAQAYGDTLFWIGAPVTMAWQLLQVVGDDMKSPAKVLVLQGAVIGGLNALLWEGPDLAFALVQVFRDAGQEMSQAAGLGQVQEVLTPQALFDDAVKTYSAGMTRVVQGLKGFAALLPMLQPLGLSLLATLICQCLIAFFMFVIEIESTVILSVGSIVLGFGGLFWFRQLFASYYRYAIGASLQLAFAGALQGLLFSRFVAWRDIINQAGPSFTLSVELAFTMSGFAGLAVYLTFRLARWHEQLMNGMTSQDPIGGAARLATAAISYAGAFQGASSAMVGAGSASEAVRNGGDGPGPGGGSSLLPSSPDGGSTTAANVANTSTSSPAGGVPGGTAAVSATSAQLATQESAASLRSSRATSKGEGGVSGAAPPPPSDAANQGNTSSTPDAEARPPSNGFTASSEDRPSGSSQMGSDAATPTTGSAAQAAPFLQSLTDSPATPFAAAQGSTASAGMKQQSAPAAQAPTKASSGAASAPSTPPGRPTDNSLGSLKASGAPNLTGDLSSPVSAAESQAPSGAGEPSRSSPQAGAATTAQSSSPTSASSTSGASDAAASVPAQENGMESAQPQAQPGTTSTASGSRATGGDAAAQAGSSMVGGAGASAPAERSSEHGGARDATSSGSPAHSAAGGAAGTGTSPSAAANVDAPAPGRAEPAAASTEQHGAQPSPVAPAQGPSPTGSAARAGWTYEAPSGPRVNSGVQQALKGGGR